MTANRSRYDGVSLSAAAKRTEDGKSFLFSSRLQAANAGGEAHWLVESTNKTIIVSSRVVTSNGNELEYVAYAGSVITDEGTPINPSPLNIAQSLKSTVKVHSSPSFSDKGIKLVPSYLPGSAGGFLSPASGNLYANEQENVLPPNTRLLLEVSNSGDVNPADIELYIVWTEVDDPAPFQS